METGRRRRRVHRLHLDAPYQAAHNHVSGESNHHSVPKRRRCMFPAAFENDDAGPSQVAESSGLSLRTRRCHSPPPAAYEVEQDGFSGFADSSDTSLRTRHRHSDGRQLRKFIQPYTCPFILITSASTLASLSIPCLDDTCLCFFGYCFL